jgi:NADP-dependent 3-hydroxy acid dehydrogenase YdfG
MNFPEQVAVVTGASSGIGKAIALGLAAEGAALALVARNVESLTQVATSARTSAQRVENYCADLGSDADVRALSEGIKRDFGRVNVLVHSAGVISFGNLEQASLDDLDWLYRVNVRAPYALTQQLLPLLKANRGQIVFINSSAGLNARGGAGQYAATKHALKAIADSLRDEVNADGVRVLSVFVGRTATPMQQGVHMNEGRAYEPERLLQPEDVAATVINALSLPRTAEVTDIHIRPMQKLK